MKFLSEVRVRPDAQTRGDQKGSLMTLSEALQCTDIRKSATPRDKCDKTCFSYNCSSTADSICSGCRSARYCSSLCQKRDWVIHKPLCQTAEGFIPTKAPKRQACEEQWYRAIILPQEVDVKGKKSAEWICIRHAGAELECQGHRSFAGLSALIQPPSSRHITTNIINISSRFAALQPHVGHMLLETSLGSAKLGLFFRNDAHFELAGPPGHAAICFGPTLIYACRPSDGRLQHASMRDFTYAVDYFRTQPGNPVVIGAPRSFPSESALGLKLNSVVRRKIAVPAGRIDATSETFKQDACKLFLIGMGFGKEVEVVNIPLDEHADSRSFPCAFAKQLGLDWWVRRGDCVDGLGERKQDALPLTDFARYVCFVTDNVCGEDGNTTPKNLQDCNAPFEEVNMTDTEAPSTDLIDSLGKVLLERDSGYSSDEHQSENGASIDNSELSHSSGESMQVLGRTDWSNGAILLFRKDGLPIHPAHLWALNYYIDIIGPTSAAAHFTRQRFEKFWHRFRDILLRNRYGWADSVASPYAGVEEGH